MLIEKIVFEDLVEDENANEGYHKHDADYYYSRVMEATDHFNENGKPV
jgi:hypothetical protein